MLTEQQKTYLRTAFDAAIKASPDSMAAASVLIPLIGKIEAMASELQELKAKECQPKPPQPDGDA